MKAPGMGDRPDREAEVKRRRERLAESLRDNLKRRKAQQRGRAAPPSDTEAPAAPKGTPDGSH